MLVSVVIAVHNYDAYLAAAIQSVLDQGHAPLEVIVVDDGSTDGSAAVARQFGPPVRYLWQEQQGPGAARNRGVDAAGGELLAFLDADDLWTPGRLAAQQAALQADPALDAVFGNIEQFLQPGLDPALAARLEYHQAMQGYSSGTMLIRTDVFRRMGGFAPGLSFGEFVDWYARAKEQGLQDLLLTQVFLRRRIHGRNFTLTAADQHSAYVGVAKAALDRRRAATGHSSAAPMGATGDRDSG